MYNRYSMMIHDDDDFVPAAAGGPPEPHHDRPGEGPSHRPPESHPFPPGPFPIPPGPHPFPPAPPPPIHNHGEQHGGDLLGSLLGRLHLTQLETDDLLLLGIAYLILRENGDEDLFLILAGLFVFGILD